MSSSIEDVLMNLDEFADQFSDYESEPGEDVEKELDAILGQLESRAPSQQRVVLETIEDNQARLHARILPSAGLLQSSSIRGYGVLQVEGLSPAASPLTIQYDELEESGCEHLLHNTISVMTLTDYQRAAQRVKYQNEGSQTRKSPSIEPSSDIPDTRTPIERFRTAPKKPLSVTDLVSPAWCELQYWYSLTKYGKKKRTPAMKQGSAVHKVLEEQVHTTVPIDVHTKEDTWGLKLWNIIQGLRTLRTTGMTRELEMWGVLDGQIVNGICDELSYTCTDPELEAHIQKTNKPSTPAPDQPIISEFFARVSGEASEKKQTHKQDRQVYITDVKTRMNATVPSGSSLRPTIMQLMIYRKLLADMADGAVDASIVFDRFKLKPDDHFSDSFISQLAGLELNLRDDSTEDTYASVESMEDAVDELLTHNSLNQLWQLMVLEFRKTFVRGVDSVSRVLRAEFRSQKNGTILGARAFAYDDETLQTYVQDEMKWWKGEREAQGVDVTEAFKCRSCEFAETCSWRISKFEEATRTSRARTSSRQNASGQTQNS